MTTFRHLHSSKIVILSFSLNSRFVGAEQILQFCFVVQAKNKTKVLRGNVPPLQYMLIICVTYDMHLENSVAYKIIMCISPFLVF